MRPFTGAALRSGLTLVTGGLSPTALPSVRRIVGADELSSTERSPRCSPRVSWFWFRRMRSESRRYASQLSFKKRAEHCGPSALEIAVLLEPAF